MWFDHGCEFQGQVNELDSATALPSNAHLPAEFPAEVLAQLQGSFPGSKILRASTEAMEARPCRALQPGCECGNRQLDAGYREK